MPRQSHSGRGIYPWLYCSRCGYKYRANVMKRQLGLILCPFDVDNTIAWTRPIIIQDKLSFSQEEELRVLDILKENQSDDVDSISS
jgi:hypothetical protein